MTDQKTILFVDDEPAVLSSLKRMLREEGWNLIGAGSGSEGLQILSGQRVDMVVADLQMPQMNGISFLETVAEKYPHCNRILLSAYVQEGSLERAMAEELVDHILTKPWDDEEVKAVIRSSLQPRSAAFAMTTSRTH